eukprot:m.246154 g.246154  ORF g.246154 m.246154 type:complete len:433 (+) comp19488_c0_seq2:184-1482(+)
MSGPGGGIAGTVDGSFFKAPGWVDLQKAPGTTKQQPAAWGPLLKKLLTGQGIIFSPNLVWLLAATVDYVFFPYDLERGKVLAAEWIINRALINFGFAFAYYGFWHVSMYKASITERKFQPSSHPSVGNLLHNVWYSSLGVLHWTAWEVLFVHMYATGKLPYVADEEILRSPVNIAMLVAWTLFIPVWRGMHFYFAHRFIHIRALYKFVHSLHHRNGDIEPFAGLCMHPIEHLYYFSCLAPSIWCATSPFIMLFNGMHLLLSPACSHSGWEDHWQSDQFHYLHHARFECNYGSASLPLDHWFGTFRDRLGKSETYKGGDTKPVTASPFKVQTSLFMSIYFLFTVAVFGVFGLAATGHTALKDHPDSVAALLAFGPILFAFALYVISGDSQSMRWPFHKEPVLGGLHRSFGFNAAVGFLVAVLPVYQFAVALLR